MLLHGKYIRGKEGNWMMRILLTMQYSHIYVHYTVRNV